MVVNIFEYIDYRVYLKDVYEAHYKANSNFSYRFIASKLGFASPGFFTIVLKGKKVISLLPGGWGLCSGRGGGGGGGGTETECAGNLRNADGTQAASARVV